MRRSTKRWILSPLTQWRARRLAYLQGAGMTTEVAWLLVRLRSNPDEVSYALSASRIPRSLTPGIRYDNWDDLTDAEKNRRLKWLSIHGRSPFQTLRIEPEYLARAGIEITDWGPAVGRGAS
jgi:hypothetical protein